MVTGHVFAMSSDHINKGFITTKVPTWEIHFPSFIPAKRRLCRPIVNMIWQLACKCLKTSLALLPAKPIPKALSSLWFPSRGEQDKGPSTKGPVQCWVRQTRTHRGRDWVRPGCNRHLVSAKSTGIWSSACCLVFSSKILLGTRAFSHSLLCFVMQSPFL